MRSAPDLSGAVDVGVRTRRAVRVFLWVGRTGKCVVRRLGDGEKGRTAVRFGRAKISARPGWAISITAIRAGFEPRRGGGSFFNVALPENSRRKIDFDSSR